MRIKCYQWKCLFLAAFVFCTGLYIETTKVVSVFACASVSSSDAYIYVADNTYDDAQLCTAETVGVRNSATGNQMIVGSTDNVKRVARIFLEFLCSVCFLLQGEIVSANPEVVESEIPYCQEIIATYIHKSDGKK